MKLTGYVDAFEQSIRSLLELTESLEPSDWERPTDLPGWTVHDVVAHLAAVECELLGEPRPQALAVYGPHVRDEFGRHMENGVAARRSQPPAATVAELRGALDRRLPQMRAMRPEDPPVRVPAGERWDTTTLLRNRAIDAWMHEQDVRRAVTRPGNLDGPGARVVREMLAGVLPMLVAKRAGAGPGQSMALHVSGAVSFSVAVVVGPDGRAAIGSVPGTGDVTAGAGAEVADGGTAELRCDWETLVRLLGGRMSPNDAVIELAGDRDLARRLVDGFAVTP